MSGAPSKIIYFWGSSCADGSMAHWRRRWWWCHSQRLLPRLLLALFLVCFFVVLSGIGIMSRLPDGSSDHQLAAAAVQLAIGGTAPKSNRRPETEEWKRNDNQFHSYEAGTDEWKQANPPWETYKVLVYSAYWDNRTKPPCVRVIGSHLTKKTPSVSCRVHFGNGDSVEMVAQMKPINEHWNLKYAGFIFSCCLKNVGSAAVPAFVTIYEEIHRNVSVTLPVHRNREERSSETPGKLALCVKPFHYNFNRAVWLLEFVEYYRMMGVEFFLFYNESVGEDVQDILVHYQNTNLVKILPWTMHVENQKEVRTENMFAALNDCNYRLMYLYKYVVFVDLDEYIVPKVHNNLTDMLASFTKGQHEEACTPSYVFQNVFFYLYWKNDTNLFSEEPENFPNFVPYLLTQYKTRRLKEPHKHGKRSKYIALPEVVLEVGNHITWRHTRACKPEKVAPSVALLHHYRICEFGGFDCLKQPSVEDRTAQKFGVELLNRVLNSCQTIFTKYGGNCPKSPPLGSPW